MPRLGMIALPWLFIVLFIMSSIIDACNKPDRLMIGKEERPPIVVENHLDQAYLWCYRSDCYKQSLSTLSQNDVRYKGAPATLVFLPREWDLRTPRYIVVKTYDNQRGFRIDRDALSHDMKHPTTVYLGNEAILSFRH